MPSVKAGKPQTKKIAGPKSTTAKAASKPKASATPQRKKSLAPPAEASTPVDEPQANRVTKQERVLTLLSRPDGASIDEMMQATKWQQHSVRGFLAGTVKKKLGFTLTSSRPADGVRRYHIKARRGR